MEMNRERMRKAYPPMPEKAVLRVEATLAHIRREAVRQPPRRYAKRLSFAMALTLALLLAAAGVAAGVHFGVFDFMGRMFGQSGVLPEAEKLVQSSLAQVELPNTVITVREALYDGGSLRLVYSVRQKDAAAPLTQDDLWNEDGAFRRALAGDEVSTQCDWFLLDGVRYEMTNGTAGDEIPGSENGEALCYLSIQLSPAGIVPREDFTLGLPLLGKIGEKRTVDFTVRAAAPSAPLPGIRGDGAVVTVLSASLSPVRTMITVRIQKDEGASREQYEAACASWRGAVLADAQGKELADLEELIPAHMVEGESMEYSYTFLPTDAAEAWLAPPDLDSDDLWAVDMNRALKVK